MKRRTSAFHRFSHERCNIGTCSFRPLYLIKMDSVTSVLWTSGSTSSVILLEFFDWTWVPSSFSPPSTLFNPLTPSLLLDSLSLSNRSVDNRLDRDCVCGNPVAKDFES